MGCQKKQTPRCNRGDTPTSGWSPIVINLCDLTTVGPNCRLKNYPDGATTPRKGLVASSGKNGGTKHERARYLWVCTFRRA